MSTKTTQQKKGWKFLEGEPDITLCRLCKPDGTERASLLHQYECGVFGGLPCNCFPIVVRAGVPRWTVSN